MVIWGISDFAVTDECAAFRLPLEHVAQRTIRGVGELAGHVPIPLGQPDAPPHGGERRRIVAVPVLVHIFDLSYLLRHHFHESRVNLFARLAELSRPRGVFGQIRVPSYDNSRSHSERAQLTAPASKYFPASMMDSGPNTFTRGSSDEGMLMRVSPTSYWKAGF